MRMSLPRPRYDATYRIHRYWRRHQVSACWFCTRSICSFELGNSSSCEGSKQDTWTFIIFVVAWLLLLGLGVVAWPLLLGLVWNPLVTNGIHIKHSVVILGGRFSWWFSTPGGFWKSRTPPRWNIWWFEQMTFPQLKHVFQRTAQSEAMTHLIPLDTCVWILCNLDAFR